MQNLKGLVHKIWVAMGLQIGVCIEVNNKTNILHVAKGIFWIFHQNVKHFGVLYVKSLSFI